jgi:hypothetical protein
VSRTRTAACASVLSLRRPQLHSAQHTRARTHTRNDRRATDRRLQHATCCSNSSMPAPAQAHGAGACTTVLEFSHCSLARFVCPSVERYALPVKAWAWWSLVQTASVMPILVPMPPTRRTGRVSAGYRVPTDRGPQTLTLLVPTDKSQELARQDHHGASLHPPFERATV